MSEPFRLEHGRRYVTRDGRVTDFSVCDLRPFGSRDKNCFFGTIGGVALWWHPRGNWLNSDVAKLDLVAEYVPPPEPKWVPFTGTDAPSLVGKAVRLKTWVDGSLATITTAGRRCVGIAVYTELWQKSLTELFDNFEFADGTPCGKRVPQ